MRPQIAMAQRRPEHKQAGRGKQAHLKMALASSQLRCAQPRAVGHMQVEVGRCHGSHQHSAGLGMAPLSSPAVGKGKAWISKT